MNSKERVHAILARKPVDRIPVDLWCTPEILEQLKNHCSTKTELDTYKALGLDKIVWVFPEYIANLQSEKTASQVGAHAEGLKTMWGVPLKRIQSGNAIYHEYGEPPLKNYNSPEELVEYPYWPDPENFDYQTAAAFAQEASNHFATIGPWVSFFEIYCQMRGLEQAMMDLVLSPDLVNAILDKIEYCQTEMMKRFFEQAKGFIDMCFISDDMGSQESLLMSLDCWDRYFKERMKRWCNLIHSYNIKVFYHTDGAAELLIPRLIECGIDVLNPIQHVCPGMDLASLKEKYGDQVIFHGGVDNQSVLPFGTVQDVIAETKRCLAALGSGNEGYICCSCHNVQPGTPIQNIIAMIETVKNIC